MDEGATSPDASEAQSGVELIRLRHDVELLMGRCLIAVQEYERLLKWLMSERNFEVVDTDEGGLRKLDPETGSKKTLGMNVKEALGSLITFGGQVRSLDKDQSDEAAHMRATFRFHIEFPADKQKSMTQSLAEFVALRNWIVHQFVEENDLSTENGCRIARQGLEAAQDRILAELGVLRAWVNSLNEARHEMAEMLSRPDVRSIIVSGEVGEWEEVPVAEKGGPRRN